jgi:hypothetical protein
MISKKPVSPKKNLISSEAKQERIRVVPLLPAAAAERLTSVTPKLTLFFHSLAYRCCSG